MLIFTNYSWTNISATRSFFPHAYALRLQFVLMISSVRCAAATNGLGDTPGCLGVVSEGWPRPWQYPGELSVTWPRPWPGRGE